MEVGTPLLCISLRGPHGAMLCDPLDEPAHLLSCTSPHADRDHGPWGTEHPAGVPHLLRVPGPPHASAGSIGITLRARADLPWTPSHAGQGSAS